MKTAYFSRLPAIAILFFCLGFSVTSQATDADVLEADQCSSLFFDEKDFPLGWGLAPGDAVKITRKAPHFENLMKSMARYADFLDNAPDEIFEELGRLAYLKTSEAMYRWHYPDAPEGSHAIAGRVLQGNLLFDLAQDPLTKEYLSQHLDEALQVVSFLGDSPFEKSFSLKAQLQSTDPRIKQYLDKKSGRIPSIQTLVEQYSPARDRIVSLATYAMGFPLNDGKELSLLGDLLVKGIPSDGDHTQFLHYKPALDQLGLILSGRADSSQVVKGLGRRLSKKESHQFVHMSALHSIVGGFAKLSLETAGSFVANAESSPLHAYLNWNYYLQSRTLIDRDADGAMRTFFVEAILQKPTLRGPAVRQILRDYLLNDGIKPVKTYYRLLQRPAEPLNAPRLQAEAVPPLPSSPSRLERMAAYTQQKRQSVEMPTIANDHTPVISQSVPVAKETDSQDLTIAQILSGQVSISEIPTHTPIPVELKRTRLIYRVSFSEEVLQEFQNPTQPHTAHEWLRALSLGPARAKGENGWKKLSLPVMGIYNWEIKIANSPWRLYGYRDGEGVWHFDRIIRNSLHKK